MIKNYNEEAEHAQSFLKIKVDVNGT